MNVFSQAMYFSRESQTRTQELFLAAQRGGVGRYLGAGRPSLNEEKLPVLTAQLDRIPRWPESTEIVVIRITTSIIPEF